MLEEAKVFSFKGRKASQLRDRVICSTCDGSDMPQGPASVLVIMVPSFLKILT